jgi:amino acid transporter
LEVCVSDPSFLSQLKRVLVGARIPSHQAHHERLSRVTGLAVLSSDALSSVAYATEEILRVLLVGGIAAMSLVTPIGLVIAVTLAIVVFSYRQTIHAYPSGGGAYIVAKENLGTAPSLIAAASLLIDYVLTVAVSVAAGVAALTSAFPQWTPYRVGIALGFVTVLMVGNLRGIRSLAGSSRCRPISSSSASSPCSASGRGGTSRGRSRRPTNWLTRPAPRSC